MPPRYQDDPEASTQGRVEKLASRLDLTVAAPDGHLLGNVKPRVLRSAGMQASHNQLLTKPQSGGFSNSKQGAQP